MIQLCVVRIEAGYGLSIYSNISASCCSLHCSHLSCLFTTMLSLNYIELNTLSNKIKRNECNLKKRLRHIDITYLPPLYICNQPWKHFGGKNCQLSNFKTQILKSLWPIKRLDNAGHPWGSMLDLHMANNSLSDIKALSLDSVIFFFT